MVNRLREESCNLGIFFPSHNLHRMYDLHRPSVRRRHPSALLLIIAPLASLHTRSRTHLLSENYSSSSICPTTTLFSQTFESPAKTESVVRGRLRHCSRLGLSLRADVTFSLWRSHPISHLYIGMNMSHSSALFLDNVATWRVTTGRRWARASWRAPRPGGSPRGTRLR